MSKLKIEYYLYLAWPRYLAQWFAHEMHRLSHFDDDHLEPYIYDCNREARQLEPIYTRRGSMVRSILEECLSKQPDPVPELPPENTTIRLVIPNFQFRRAEIYNYLSPASKHLLEDTVRTSFKVALTKYMNKVMFKGIKTSTDCKIAAFMEINGIEYTDTNAEAIRKIWQRLYHQEYYKNQRK